MRVLAVIVLAGCGRIAFDPLDDAAGGGSDDVDASLGTANRVFVSRGIHDGNFGGLAGANAFCMAEAAMAGLSGTYVALLGDTASLTEPLTGSRGWVRTDGEPFLDRPEDYLLAGVFNPVTTHADGLPITDLASIVWLGTDGAGTTTFNCEGWTNNTTASGELGSSFAAPPQFSGNGVVSCNQSFRVMCFEVGTSVQVKARATPGRIIFVTKAGRTATGLAALDAMCTAEAQQASLPGTYLAGVATTSSTIADRFALDARPWVRPDGTLLADGGLALFAGSARSFIHQAADGTYLPAIRALTGATTGVEVSAGNNSCIDWSTITVGTAAVGNNLSTYPSETWSYGGESCNIATPVRCFQE